MKVFSVEFIRKSYLDFSVEAIDEDEAIEKAQARLEESYPNQSEYWEFHYSKEIEDNEDVE